MLTYRSDHRQIHQPAVTRSVEIYQMQTPSTLVNPSLSNLDRIRTKDRFALIIALLQAHTLTTPQVDRWPDLHQGPQR